MAVQLKPGIVATVPLGELERDVNQPRKTFPEEMLDAMGASMLVKIDYPLLVRVDGKRKIIYDGECRWRAAKRMKILKLPCLLYEGPADAIARGAGQITTSLQRSGLNPLDVATFLVDLQRREKKSTNELLAALAKRGITDIGSHALDRLMRLVDLPEWVKQYIAQGVFNEGHGLAALPALPFPKVMKLLQMNVKSQISWRGSITVKEFSSQLEGAFRQQGIDLNNEHGDHQRLFPIEQCKRCEFYKKISGTEYCLNVEEFKRKNQEALKVQAEQKAKRAERQAAAGAAPDDRSNPDPQQVTPRKVKKSDDGFVAIKRMASGTFVHLDGARFDVATCDGCQHQHLASYDGKKNAADGGLHCFHPPCFQVKQNTGQRQESRREKLREYFEAWLRPVVLAYADKAMSQSDHHGLHMWMATGAPEFYSRFYPGQRHAEAARRTESYLQHYKLTDLASFMAMPYTEDRSKRLSVCAIQTMTREQIRWFAQHLQISLAAPGPTLYEIDERYLALKRKEELIELARLAGLETVAGLGAADLRTALLAPGAPQKIGVPADITAVYLEPFQQRGADVEDDMAEVLENEMFCIGCGCSEFDPCETPSGPCSWAKKNWQIVKGNRLGVCTAPACEPFVRAWDRGEREPSAEALEHRRMLAAMTGGAEAVESEAELGDALAQAAETAPTKRKRGRS